jgi:O-antigen/teichoic acid export membrane protein
MTDTNATTGGGSDRPGETLSAQVARSGAWGFSGRAILMLANLGATPFTVRLLGPSAYGLWALVQTVLAWASPAQAGQDFATTKYGSECYAAGDASGESTVVWSGFCFTLGMTVPVGLALALGAHFLLALLHVRGALLSAGTWALRVACASFVLSSLAGVANTAEQVRLRWKQYTIFNVSGNLVRAIGVPLAIYLFSGGVVLAAVVGLFAVALYFVLLSLDALHLQPSLLHPQVDRKTLRKLISYGGAMAVYGIAVVPLETGERFFLAANTSVTWVAYYAVAMTIATTLQVFPEQLVGPLMPALARIEAAGRHDELRALYQKSLSGLFLVITPTALVVALVARPFLSVWAGPAYGAHGAILLMVALVGVWANGLSWVPDTYLLSSGRTKVRAALTVAELPAYLAAAWWLTAKWGALGAAVVWSTRLVVDSVAQFAIARRVSRLPVLPLSERRARSVLAPLMFGAICLGVSLVTRGLLERSGAAMVLVIAYFAGVWWLVFTARERRGVTRLVEEVLGKGLTRGRPLRTAA